MSPRELTPGEKDRQLEMRLRISQKLSKLLAEEAKTAKIDALEGAHILGLTLGFALAAAPEEHMRKAVADAHQFGIDQAINLRAALDMMGVNPGGR